MIKISVKSHINKYLGMNRVYILSFFHNFKYIGKCLRVATDVNN
jgi:hypothetical protein